LNFIITLKFKETALIASANVKGFKRICTSCGTRFYDLGKRPIICPGCNNEFTGEIKVKARRGRLAAEKAPEGLADKASRSAVVTGALEEETSEDVISLDDVKKMEEGADDEEDALEEDALGDLDADIDEDDDLEEDLDVKIEKD
jgi:uncharacterized protein (TIGR02300 family)